MKFEDVIFPMRSQKAFQAGHLDKSYVGVVRSSGGTSRVQ